MRSRRGMLHTLTLPHSHSRAEIQRPAKPSRRGSASTGLRRPLAKRIFRSNPRSWTKPNRQRRVRQTPFWPSAVAFARWVGKEREVRVFITGATGFVGGHVARSYAAEGASLRLLTRKTSRLDSLTDIEAEMVIGDLREPEKLRSALTGCDT